jgi:penicillin-binding protein 2
MYLRRDEVEPERRTSPLALRISIITGLAIAIFSVLFLRLWYVQVLSGDQYRNQANDNRIREIRVQAPRGDILDRNGRSGPNRTELAIGHAQDLPPPGPDRSRELKQLATVTGMTMKEIRKALQGGSRAAPGGPVILKKGLGVDKVYYLRENQSSFPGVSVESVFTRDYRQGTIAAHLFGNVGEVTAEQLKERRYAGLHPGDQVGQSGVEYEYDRYLRGRPGTDRVQVDALGRPTGQLRSVPAEPGDDVRLTVDSNLQATGEGALDSFGLPGAFVAMNAQNGDILAMGSAPTFDPSIFTQPITQSEYRDLTSRKTDAPWLTARSRASIRPVRRSSRSLRPPLSGPPDLAEHDLQRHRLAQNRQQPDPAQRGQGDLWAARHERCPQGLLRHLLLQPRPQVQVLKGPRHDPGLGASVRAGGEDRDRPAGRGRRADPDSRLAQPALRPEAHR